MEENEATKLKYEISTKIKLPKEEKNKIYSKIFNNLLLAVGIMIFFIFLNLGYLTLAEEVFKVDLKVFAVILLFFTLYYIEKAYRTGRGTFVAHAIELGVLSVITLYLPYVYFYQSDIAQFLFKTASIYITIYYIIKCICMYNIYKKRYIHRVSDISEIVKDKKVSYLDEESSKVIKELNEEKMQKEQEERLKNKRSSNVNRVKKNKSFVSSTKKSQSKTINDTDTGERAEKAEAKKKSTRKRTTTGTSKAKGTTSSTKTKKEATAKATTSRAKKSDSVAKKASSETKEKTSTTKAKAATSTGTKKKTTKSTEAKKSEDTGTAKKKTTTKKATTSKAKTSSAKAKRNEKDDE